MYGKGSISFKRTDGYPDLYSLCIILFFLLHAVPNPAVMITNTPASPICPIGSTVTLTCTVDLSPLVDIPVNVTAQISGPMGITVFPVANSVMESNTRYTSTATVGPFGRNHSGEYTCLANIRLVTANSFIIGGTGVTGMDRITVGTGKMLYNMHYELKQSFVLHVCRCLPLSKGSGLC